MSSPYNWQSHNPKIRIPRTDVGRAAELLRENGSVVVMGGRGMGKSVFLGQLKTELERDPRTRVLLIEAPPPTLTVEDCLGLLAELLGVAGSTYGSRAIFEPQIGLLATGSIGIFIVRDVLGSSFLARALHLRLRPLERTDAEVLARPFADRGTPLSAEALDALLLASGGIPALLTYGLQELWKLDREATPDSVTAIYKSFQEEHFEYLRDLLQALQDPRFSDAPLRVWERIQGGGGPFPRADLERDLAASAGTLNLGVADALHLLEAVGVVRLESSAMLDDPITAHPIASLLNLPRWQAIGRAG